MIAAAQRRGFKIRVDPGPPPMPILNGDRAQATDALMQALRAWRLEIIEELQAKPAGEMTEQEKEDNELRKEQEEWRARQAANRN